jgi:hypothetical protein
MAGAATPPTLGGGATYTPPSLTPISSHAVQRKVGSVRWRPLIDTTSSDAIRTLAIGSTGETTNALTLRTFDTTPTSTST